MYNRLSQWEGDSFAPEELEEIRSKAQMSATRSLAANPRLAHLLTGRVPKHVESVTATAQFIKAAELLQTDHLSRREQEIARLMVGAVVVFGGQFTALALSRALGTRPDTVRKAVSVLAIKQDQYAPRELQYQYPTPLITEVGGADEPYLGPSEALTWLAEEPDRSPYIAEAIADVAALQDTIVIDSL